MASSTSTFPQTVMNKGQVLSLANVGDSDTLTINGWASADGYMIMGVTRTRGISIYRHSGDPFNTADVFCLDTGVEFILKYVTYSGRCPADETRVVMANDNSIQTPPDAVPEGTRSVDYWYDWLLFINISSVCNYTGGCEGYSDRWLTGTWVTGFDSVPYSSSNSHLELGI